ncbi:Hypothetical predicted protein [Cloeon dipterum]|uniref:Uncharacterized protein n=1 Tax=Cloeon dipterum TaxID=197152 RepID=A0A8S1E4N6_9INSE|nr:Hypothetical predicted protein [Cloeon dipterum]
MAEKQTSASAGAAPKNEDLEFPYEWVAQHCDSSDSSFAISKELAVKFAKLKTMNEAADEDAQKVLQSLKQGQQETLKQIQKQEQLPLPLSLQTIGPDTKKIFEDIAEEMTNNRSHIPVNNCEDEFLGKELAKSGHQLDIAKMERVSEELDLIIDQIKALKQQFLGDCEESDEDKNERKASDSVDFLEEKAAACKEDFNEDASKKYCKSFQEYQEVKAFLIKLEQEKNKEAELDAALAKYSDLPPDIELAEKALKQKEKEMKELNAEIEFLKNNIGDGTLDMFNQ